MLSRGKKHTEGYEKKKNKGVGVAITQVRGQGGRRGKKKNPNKNGPRKEPKRKPFEGSRKNLGQKVKKTTKSKENEPATPQKKKRKGPPGTFQLLDPSQWQLGSFSE